MPARRSSHPRPVVLAALALLLAACGGDAAGERAQRDGSAVVWAVGDGATATPDAEQLGDRIAADEPARLLYLGDVYPEGRREDYDERYHPVYGELAEVTAPTPGNHDWDGREAGYDAYWAEKQGRAPGSFYAFDLAGWQIISLNSEAQHDAGSGQVAFVREEVRRRPGTCRLAFWHRPRYSAGKYGEEDLAPFWDALRGHAVLVLNGHDHNTQRFEPREGITQIVAGAGGANFYAVDRAEPGLAWADDTQRVGVRLTLRPGSADYAMVTGDGRTLDSGRVSCEALAAAP